MTPDTPADGALAEAIAELPMVKPLVWEDPCKENNYTHVARSIFGEYYIHIDGGRHQAWLEANAKPYENLIGAEVGNLLKAKDIAVADYEARVHALLIPRPAEPAQAAQVEIERNRAEAYQGGWDDGYAEGFGKAVALVMDGIPKETAYGRGVRSLVSDIIAAAQEGRE